MSAARRLGPALAWMALIFWFSHQPDIPHVDVGWLDFLVKKGLHAAAYGVLALLWLRAAPPSVALAICLAWAASDEWHQTFVPGRSGRPRDVVIDALGASVALGMAERRGRSRITPRPAEPS